MCWGQIGGLPGARNRVGEAMDSTSPHDCQRHLFVEMTRRRGNVVAVCNACRERIEVPVAEFDQLFAQGLAVGKAVRL